MNKLLLLLILSIFMSGCSTIAAGGAEIAMHESDVNQIITVFEYLD